MSRAEGETIGLEQVRGGGVGEMRPEKGRGFGGEGLSHPSLEQWDAGLDSKSCLPL